MNEREKEREGKKGGREGDGKRERERNLEPGMIKISDISINRKLLNYFLF